MRANVTLIIYIMLSACVLPFLAACGDSQPSKSEMEHAINAKANALVSLLGGNNTGSNIEVIDAKCTKIW